MLAAESFDPRLIWDRRGGTEWPMTARAGPGYSRGAKPWRSGAHAAAHLAHPARGGAGGRLAGRQALLERGPEITITFKTAEGLEAGKTKIKYKDVEIGVVKTSHLSPDRRAAWSRPRSARADEFLREDTRFWVVGRGSPGARCRASRRCSPAPTSAWIPANRGRRDPTSSASRAADRHRRGAGTAVRAARGRPRVARRRLPGVLPSHEVGQVVSTALDTDGEAVTSPSS